MQYNDELIYMYDAVHPLAWACPDDCTELHDFRPGLPAPCMGFPAVDPLDRPAKKQATQSSFQRDVQ